MTVVPFRHARASVAGVLLLAACATTAPRTPDPVATAPASSATSAAAVAATEHGAHGAHAAAAPASAGGHAGHGMGMGPITIPPGALYTEADVRFMQGMIAHHAQAVHMSRLAEARGASPRLVRFAQKIDLSQAGEIALMQGWLVAHGQYAPDTSSWRTMTMHGMLTAEEIARLEAARGPAFERLFLEYMIRHHEGALQMVADLFATPRAAQDVDVSVLANDVESTQTAEIGMMRVMLAEM